MRQAAQPAGKALGPDDMAVGAIEAGAAESAPLDAPRPEVVQLHLDDGEIAIVRDDTGAVVARTRDGNPLRERREFRYFYRVEQV